jgi:hypothetical protein
MSGGEAGVGASESQPRRARAQKHWHERPTVWTLKKQAKRSTRPHTLDSRDNEDTKLPSGEGVHLGGIVLAEAFTPSTVSSLYRSLERWETHVPGRKEEWLTQLERSRSGVVGGWQNLGVVRPPGTFTIGDAQHDPTLPTGVAAAWVHVSYITPTLAMAVATFTISEEAGDLSSFLSQDYVAERRNFEFRVYGRFGRLRARIPWARPSRYRQSHSVVMPDQRKRESCQSVIKGYEDACSSWFFQKFPGRFRSANSEERPVLRILLTKNHVPFADRPRWLEPVDLAFAVPLWRSVASEGWWLSEERFGSRDRYMLTVAARRGDVASSLGGGENDGSNWAVTQRFADDATPLAARYAILALLALYGRRLGALRDRAGGRRFLRRMVREARNLDDFLIRDGLDAATLTNDLSKFTANLGWFRLGVPEFIEDRTGRPHQMQKGPTPEFVPWLCDAIREQAARLADDTAASTGNIQASAELRQAITNTVLQRLIVVLTLVAISLAIISLLTAKH